MLNRYDLINYYMQRQHRKDYFTGEWVEQFGGDKEKFLLIWNKWHKDNMNMLKEYKLFDIGYVS